jgi:hypothetical protein
VKADLAAKEHKERKELKNSLCLAITVLTGRQETMKTGRNRKIAPS